MALTIQTLIAQAKEIIPDLNEQKILEAFEFAEECHQGQTRLSGEPYVMHPLAVAYNLLSLCPDEDSIIAALLHDVLEDTEVTPAEIEKRFGANVLKLSQGVEKINKIHLQGKDRQIGSLRKMFLAMAEDLRVIFIKLSDRLHNISTLDSVPPEKQKRMAEETLEIYAPIAGRLGIYHFKTPLEDLSFKYLYPEQYRWIVQEIAKMETKREKNITRLINLLRSTLQNMEITFEISGRVKHYYSIYKKLQKQHKDNLEEIYDIFALRIIVNDTRDCYAALGEIHKYWTPLSYRFKDYIAVPKPNGYQSLHTTIIGILSDRKSQPVEIQIRTKKMHREAEYGIAAHWSYKEHNARERTKWLQGLVDLEQSLQDNIEFEENLKKDTFGDRIFVLTPGGDIKDLPNGATPVDFAYAVHTEVGNHCSGARVNEKIVSLDQPLGNGDVVEILINKHNHPNQFWLNFVVTSQAKQRIKAWFRNQDYDKIIKTGKDFLNQQLKRLGKNELDQHLLILKNYENKNLNAKEREQVLEKIGNGSLSPILVIKKLFPKDPLFCPIKNEKIYAISDKNQEVPRVIVSGEDIYKTKLAACCNPSVNDNIVGYVTRGGYISVHKQNCNIIQNLKHQERLIEVYWSNRIPQQRVKLVIRVMDRIGLVRDVANVFAVHNINIVSIESGDPALSKGFHNMYCVISIDDFDRLNHIINRLESLEGVKDVQRILT